MLCGQREIWRKKIIDSGNTGKFFRYANSKSNARHNVGPLRQSDGDLTTDPAAKVELQLSAYFSSVFTIDNGFCATTSDNKTSGNISNILFTEQQVNRVISTLKANSARGPDVPPIFFKRCRSNLVAPLAFLYQLFFWFCLHATGLVKGIHNTDI